MPRPSKETTLDRLVAVRLSAEDYAEFRKRAEQCGLPVSTWLRKAALGRRLQPAKPAPIMEVWGILGRILEGIAMLKEGSGGVNTRGYDLLAQLVVEARRKLVS